MDVRKALRHSGCAMYFEVLSVLTPLERGASKTKLKTLRPADEKALKKFYLRSSFKI